MSWDAAVASAEKRLTGYVAPGGGDRSVTTDDPQWSGTPTMQDAIKLARYGWQAGTDAVLRELDSLPVATDVLPDWSLDAGGSFPCVPAFLSGEPECIWRLTDGRKAERRMTLVIPAGFSARIEGEQSLTYATAVAAVLRNIEASGVSVALKATVASVGNHNKTMYLKSFTVRDHGEPFDVSKVAFAAHPSFARRIGFAWREQDADAAPHIGCDSYGFSLPEHWLLSNLGAHLGDCGLVVLAPHPGALGLQSVADTVAEVSKAVDKAIAAAA